MSKKLFLAVIAVLLLCSLLSACFSFGGSKVDLEKELPGEWLSIWEYEGNEITCKITFSENGRYTKILTKNRKAPQTTYGDYEIDGKEVKLYDPDTLTYHGSWTVMKYSNGRLRSGNHIYEKQN